MKRKRWSGLTKPGPQRGRSKLRVAGLVALVAALMLAGAGIHIALETYLASGGLDVMYFLTLPELLTNGYTEVTVTPDVVDGQGLIILNAGCVEIAAYTEAEKAESIARGQAGYVDVRPDEYDVMRDAFNNFGITVSMLKITEVRDGTFIGRLILQKDKTIANLDIKPSVGTAIAVRTNAPIFINDTLLEEYGEDVC